ncbi:probable disease resistance protein At1g61190 [Camellia sinensis]|uniref:probable disease resistance protein At1g61190 n=1 Tax=Camellia sinensis TaxID=4442 RepID=UPI001036A03A|nr:probable disease resistance protein At1g61190 [Camellia sinensis]
MRAPPIICPLPKNIRFHLSCLHQEQEEEQTQKQLPEREGGRSVSNYRMVGGAGVAGVAVSTGTAAATGAYGCFKPHFDYVYDLDKNYKELNKESDELSELKRDTEIHISQNESAMEMTNQCRNWLRNVRTAEGKIQDLKQRYKKASKCLCGMCPFLKLRKLSKSIFDTTKDVVKLKTKMNELKQNANVMTTRRPPPLATNIVELNSLTNNAQELLNLLGQKDLKRIGIFGMKGVGKTTLLEKLYAEAGQNCRFDIAILVSCQEEDSVRKLQEYLLRQLELTVNENDSTKKVGDRISEKLENMEYLLLLDQVFSCINLHEVGIRDCHKYGKAVFASREKIICKEMDANEYFQVKLLPLEDAVALFQTIVGDVVRTNKTIEGIAKKIAKELGGLPLAIKAMAIDLKHENYVCTWQNAVWTLQQAIDGPQQHLQEVFNIFELLYGQLHVNMRRCLLYAALFPGGYEIYKDYLVEGWKVQGLIRDVQGGNGQTFEDARIRGDYFLEHLTELSLLAKCLKEKYIKMPELVRNQAHHLYPKEEECQIVVEACTEEKEWRDAGRIALMHNRPLSLPKKPKCGKLSTLLLQRNDDLEIIPKSFFTHMKKLQILDLYHTSIKLLPPSLFSLIDLKALYLNDCPCLAVLSSKIAKLQNLEILDIRETGIRSLPIEIGKLKNLKCFRVSFPYNDAIADSPETNILHCWKHKKPRVMIPPNLIRKLHLLEELTIIVDPKDQSWKGIADYIAEEVASLKHLTIRRVPGQASPSVYGTPPEGSPSVNRHGIIRSQPLDCDKAIPLANLNHNHNNGEIQEASSSNSMTAAARPLPPSDPSPSTWASQVTHHSRLSVKKSQPTDPNVLSPSIMTNNGCPD